MTTSPAPIIRSAERLAAAVQTVGRRPVDIQRRRWESATVFVAFTVFYSIVGYWLVIDLHLVGFETLDRFNRSLMVVHDEPGKLAAVGSDYPPLSVLLLLPFSVIPALARSLILIPIASAVFAGLTMMVINTMMRRARISLPLRLAILLGLGLNPLVVMYAGLGARDFLWLAFVVAALGALFAWYVTADVRFVLVAGLSYAVAALTGYPSLVWFVLSLVMVAAILARLGADSREIEGTTLGLAAPTVYVVVLWTALNLVVLSDPFDWITASSDRVPAAGLGDVSAMQIVSDTVDLVVYGAPVAIVVLPALVFTGIARSNDFALWLGVMLAASILAPGLAASWGLTGSPLVMSNALPILLVSVVGAVWLARSAMPGGLPLAGLLSGALLVSIPWTFASLDTFDRQGLERAFHDAVVTRETQEGARTLDGSVVGYDYELDMATFIRANVTEPSTILTDDASTYAVMLLTGSPTTFFDRVDASDGAWIDAARDPAAHVDYLLLSADPASDLLTARYPRAAASSDPWLPVAHTNRRYTLVEVPDGYVAAPPDPGAVGDPDLLTEDAATRPLPPIGAAGDPTTSKGSTP